MPISWNPAADHTLVMGGGEVLLHQPHQESASYQFAYAHRGAVTTADVDGSQGKLFQSDLDWRCQASAGQPIPQIGDSLIDSAGVSWVVLRVTLASAVNRLRMKCRSFGYAGGKLEPIDVERPLNQEGAGAEWVVVYPGVDAVLVHEMLGAVDPSNMGAGSHTVLRVYFVDPPDIEEGDRLRAADGRTLDIIELRDFERCDAPALARVEVNAGVP